MIAIVWLVITFTGPLGQLAAVSVPEPNLDACQGVAGQVRLQHDVETAICLPGMR